MLRRWHQIGVKPRTRMFADRRGRFVATRQHRELLVRVAQRLQTLQNAFVRNVTQMQETGHRCAEGLQLGEFVLGVGQLCFQTGQLFADGLWNGD